MLVLLSLNQSLIKEVLENRVTDPWHRSELHGLYKLLHIHLFMRQEGTVQTSGGSSYVFLRCFPRRRPSTSSWFNSQRKMFLLIHVNLQMRNFQKIYRRERCLAKYILPCVEVMWEPVHDWLSQVSWYVIPGLIAKVWVFSWSSTWAALLENGHGQVSAK